VDCIGEQIHPDEDYKCGWCSSIPTDDGTCTWKLQKSLGKGKRAKTEVARKNDDTPKSRGWTAETVKILKGAKRSWDEMREESQRRGMNIRLEQKRLKKKAAARLKRGGHHIVDETTNGGTALRSLTPELIDQLEADGELDFIHVDDANPSDMSLEDL
jgi:hypothetical protein